MIKEFIRPLIPAFILKKIQLRSHKLALRTWEQNGCPSPPPDYVKHLTIQEYQKATSYKILVETGTYLGNMVEAQKHNFEKIYSIELGIELYEKAKRRFQKNGHIFLMQGDSGVVLKSLMDKLNEPAIFWLDAHYSHGTTSKGAIECPIFEEIDAIFNGKNLNHVLLIDDARDFNGKNDYPTLEEITSYVKGKNSKYNVEVKHDIIRFTS